MRREIPVADLSISAEREAMDTLQLALSKTVDLARELPRGCVTQQYEALVGLYTGQISAAVFSAREDSEHESRRT